MRKVQSPEDDLSGRLKTTCSVSKAQNFLPYVDRAQNTDLKTPWIIFCEEDMKASISVTSPGRLLTVEDKLVHIHTRRYLE